MTSKDSLRLGRGQKAPYQTMHYRIPTPIKPLVEQISDEYKKLIFSGENPEELIKKISQSLGDNPPSNTAELEEEIKQLQALLKGAREHSDEVELQGLKAATILHEALKLKPNAGGAIKVKIKEALQCIDDI